jgi:4-hydroxy-tetrahydrodipicolinate synthase
MVASTSPNVERSRRFKDFFHFKKDLMASHQLQARFRSPLPAMSAPRCMNRTPFSGTYTALVTPFRDDRVDETALQRLVQAQIRAGVDGVVPVGTTGESPTLDFEEHIRVIQLTVQIAAGKLKVVAGTGANATKEAIYLTEQALKAGADASLQVAPYYNRPTQEGLFQHFAAIAASTTLPLILYSIPSRCGVEIGIDTLQRLTRRFPNVVGLKEAGGNVDRISQLRAALGPRFTLLSGDDALTLPFLAAGAHGVVSVASNVIPRQVARLVASFRAGQPEAALRLHDRFYPLFKDLFIETNPAPVKAALALLGLTTEDVRLPLVALTPANKDRLRATLTACGVLKA